MQQCIAEIKFAFKLSYTGYIIIGLHLTDRGTENEHNNDLKVTCHEKRTSGTV